MLSLPGATFEIKFKQYAGYLDAGAGNHLYYWCVVFELLAAHQFAQADGVAACTRDRSTHSVALRRSGMLVDVL